MNVKGEKKKIFLKAKVDLKMVALAKDFSGFVLLVKKLMQTSKILNNSSS